MESEMQLVEAARNGDEAAAVRLIELFYARIYSFLRRFAGSDADAADLTQRTFGAAWKALPGFAGRSTFSSWIHSIAYHVYVDWRRSNRAGETRSDQWWDLRPSEEPSPDLAAVRSDLSRALYAAVDRLDQDLRDTVHLHYYQDLTLQETADAMEVATSTVKYRLRQALEQLQRAISRDPVSRGSAIHLKET